MSIKSKLELRRTVRDGNYIDLDVVYNGKVLFGMSGKAETDTVKIGFRKGKDSGNNVMSDNAAARVVDSLDSSLVRLCMLGHRIKTENIFKRVWIAIRKG